MDNSQIFSKKRTLSEKENHENSSNSKQQPSKKKKKHEKEVPLSNNKASSTSEKFKVDFEIMVPLLNELRKCSNAVSSSCKGAITPLFAVGPPNSSCYFKS